MRYAFRSLMCFAFLFAFFSIENAMGEDGAPIVNLQIDLEPNQVNEGSNIDINIRLISQLDFRVIFYNPELGTGTLDYEIYNLNGQRLTNPVTIQTGYLNKGLWIDARATYNLHLLLFNNINGNGPEWLEPGKYKIRAVFTPIKPSQIGFAHSGKLAWNIPVCSQYVEFTINPSPANNELLNKAKKFLSRYYYPHSKEEYERYVKEYNELLSSNLEQSLQKRIILRYSSGCSAANAVDKNIVYDNLRNMSEKHELTEAEKEKVFNELGNYYFNERRYGEAKFFLENTTNYNAKVLLKDLSNNSDIDYNNLPGYKETAQKYNEIYAKRNPPKQDSNNKVVKDNLSPDNNFKNIMFLVLVIVVLTSLFLILKYKKKLSK